MVDFVPIGRIYLSRPKQTCIGGPMNFWWKAQKLPTALFAAAAANMATDPNLGKIDKPSDVYSLLLQRGSKVLAEFRLALDESQKPITIMSGLTLNTEIPVEELFTHAQLANGLEEKMRQAISALKDLVAMVAQNDHVKLAMYYFPDSPERIKEIERLKTDPESQATNKQLLETSFLASQYAGQRH